MKDYETKVLEAREIPDSTRKHMPEGDFAGKGRSFPIETPEDVHAAAQSIGRAGADNHDAGTLKANIKHIAKRKGPEFEARLPESWKEPALAACEVQMTDKGQRISVRLSGAVDGLVRVPLAKLGSFIKGKQKFAITRRTFGDIVANFRKRLADTVIDYEHASDDPEVAQGGPVPAAGWIKAVEDAPDSDGVLYGHAEFTPRAQKMIDDKEYRYLSPVIDWGARNKETGEAQGATLTSVALTNRPFLDMMPAIAMSERGWKEIGRGDAAGETKGERAVKVILTDRAASKVRVVNDDGSENTLTLEGLEAAPKIVKLSDVRRTNEGVLDFSALETGEGVLIAGEVFVAMKAQQELDAAVKDGKITPAQRPHYEKIALSDLPTFRAIVAGLPKAVETGERGIGGGDGSSDLQKVQGALLSKVDEKMKADPKLGYGDALKLVASENPDLDKRYTELNRRRATGVED